MNKRTIQFEAGMKEERNRRDDKTPAEQNVSNSATP